MNRHDIHRQVIDHYGWKHQVVKLIDEIEDLKAELWEYLDNEKNIDKVIHEFADVLNMIEQFEIIAKENELFTHLDVDKVQNFKMNRQLERITR